MVRGILRGFSVIMCSGVVGLGIGFLQGELLYRGEIRTAEMAFAEGAAVIGAEVSMILGPLLYYGLFRRRGVTFEFFASVVSTTATVAVLSGLFLVVMGWTTLFVTALAAIVSAILLGDQPGSEEEGRRAAVKD